MALEPHRTDHGRVGALLTALLLGGICTPAWLSYRTAWSLGGELAEVVPRYRATVSEQLPEREQWAIGILNVAARFAGVGSLVAVLSAPFLWILFSLISRYLSPALACAAAATPCVLAFGLWLWAKQTLVRFVEAI